MDFLHAMPLSEPRTYMRPSKRFIRKAFSNIAKCFAFVARKERLSTLSKAMGQSTAQLVVSSKGLQRAHNLKDLGETWQRAFPSKKLVPIESISDNTVFAQIHDHCSLRGSGDVQACYRMMEFDRGVLERIGGQLVVLESQATPGISRCRVAMRMVGQDMSDLEPAHIANPAASNIGS